MSLPFDHDRISVRPLTKEAAKKAGHIAWIEDNDPVRAIRRMYSAVAKEGYNCAVWADADKQWKAEEKTAIREWRDKNQLSITAYFTSLSKKDADAVLTPKFQSARKKSSDAQALGALKNHIAERVRQMNAAINPAHCGVDLRASGTTTAFEDAHIDGEIYGNLRFFESIESRSTCIIANSDVRLKGPATGKKPGFNDYELNPKGPVTYWELPANSLCLISNIAHNRQPVMHSVPPTPKGEKPQKRTILVLDIGK